MDASEELAEAKGVDVSEEDDSGESAGEERVTRSDLGLVMRVMTISRPLLVRQPGTLSFTEVLALLERWKFTVSDGDP